MDIDLTIRTFHPYHSNVKMSSDRSLMKTCLNWYLCCRYRNPRVVVFSLNPRVKTHGWNKPYRFKPIEIRLGDFFNPIYFKLKQNGHSFHVINTGFSRYGLNQPCGFNPRLDVIASALINKHQRIANINWPNLRSQSFYISSSTTSNRSNVFFDSCLIFWFST